MHQPKANEVPITVVTRPTLLLAGLCVRTDMKNAQRDCSKLWHDTFVPRMGEFGSLTIAESYGVSWVVDMDTGTFDYWAAVPVPASFTLPEGMSRTTLPEGLYAELAVPSLAELTAAYTRIYGDWLPKQTGYAISVAAPSFEVYPADHCMTGTLTLYFPIKKTGDV